MKMAKRSSGILAGLVVAALVFLGASCGGSGAPGAGSSTLGGPTIAGGGTAPGGSGGGGASPAGSGGSSGGGAPLDDLDGDGIPDAEDDDADGDGFLASEDDCEDLDPSIFPGAEDAPDVPDYTDSNCDGVDGDALLSYWVAPDGHDMNPGTIDQPFLTIEHAIGVATGDPADVRDVYVVGGLYDEHPTLLEGVGVYGGYGPLEGMARSRDIEANLTRIQNDALYTVVGPSSTPRNSVLEGFEITGLANAPALVVSGSDGTIRHNRIIGVESVNQSIGVYVIAAGAGASGSPVFHDNVIESGEANNIPDSASSIGLFALAGGGATLDLTLYDNRISAGEADYMSVAVNAIDVAGGETSLTAYGNSMTGSEAGFAAIGLLLGQDAFGEIVGESFMEADIYRNHIEGGRDAFHCAGIFLSNGGGGSLIRNNFVTGGRDCGMHAIGLMMNESDADIENNTFNAGSAGFMAAAIYFENDVTSNVTNNILYAEDAMSTAGIAEMAPNTTPKTLQNNLFYEDLNVYYVDFATGPKLVIDDVNAMADMLVNQDNVDGDPMFVDPAGNDYHVGEDSDAVDMGLDIFDLEDDLDGDERTDGAFDIGADELNLES